MEIKFWILFLAIVIAGDCRHRDVDNQEDFEFIEDTKDKSREKGSLVWISDPNNELCSLLRCGQEELCLLQDRFTAVCVSKHEAKIYGDHIITPNKESKVEKTKTETFDDSYDDDDEYLLNDEEEDDLDDQGFEKEDEQQDSRAETDVPKLIRKPFARKQCPTCPVVRPVFLCGSDNKTYSSVCRLHLHNCLHEEKIRISCKGFCPCKDPNIQQSRKQQQKQRMKAYMKKLHTTAMRKAAQNSQSTPTEVEETQKTETWRGHTRVPHVPKTHKKAYKYHEKKSSSHSKHSSKRPSNNDNRYWSRKYDRKQETNYETENTVWGTTECSVEALEAMGNRMLDWFSVIMTDSRRRNGVPTSAPTWCKKEVAWMLGHLDQDHDSKLSTKELYRLEHDDRERCIKPFIDRCDLDRDSFLSVREWCKCFDRTQRPCAALRKASKGLLGGYIPECDGDGYYRSTQCHVSAAMCWCVDKHGVEVPGSRTREAPHCDDTLKGAHTNRIDDDTEYDSEDVDRNEGSADMPLDI